MGVPPFRIRAFGGLGPESYRVVPRFAGWRGLAGSDGTGPASGRRPARAYSI